MEPAQQNSLADALDRLWAQFLPEMRARVSIIEAAAKAGAAGRLSTAQRQAAHEAAHKLAGVLGTFGLGEGTALARELEALCDSANTPDPRVLELVAGLRRLIENRGTAAKREG